MNRLKLLLFSVSPYIIGYLLSYAMLKFDWYGKIISIISILFCVYWFFVGYKSYDYVKSTKESILLGNCFGIVSIILIMLQKVVLGSFMPNIIGYGSQNFFLPIISVSSWIEGNLLFFLSTHYMDITFIVSFLLTMVIYYAGYWSRLKRL